MAEHYNDWLQAFVHVVDFTQSQMEPAVPSPTQASTLAPPPVPPPPGLETPPASASTPGVASAGGPTPGPA